MSVPEHLTHWLVVSYGSWGRGTSRKIAEKAWRKAGGRASDRPRIYYCTEPTVRMDADGMICFTRRHDGQPSYLLVEKMEPKKKTPKK